MLTKHHQVIDKILIKHETKAQIHDKAISKRWMKKKKGITMMKNDFPKRGWHDKKKNGTMKEKW